MITNTTHPRKVQQALNPLKHKCCKTKLTDNKPCPSNIFKKVSFYGIDPDPEEPQDHNIENQPKKKVKLKSKTKSKNGILKKSRSTDLTADYNVEENTEVAYRNALLNARFGHVPSITGITPDQYKRFLELQHQKVLYRDFLLNTTRNPLEELLINQNLGNLNFNYHQSNLGLYDIPTTSSRLPEGGLRPNNYNSRWQNSNPASPQHRVIDQQYYPESCNNTLDYRSNPYYTSFQNQMYLNTENYYPSPYNQTYLPNASQYYLPQYLTNQNYFIDRLHGYNNKHCAYMNKYDYNPAYCTDSFYRNYNQQWPGSIHQFNVQQQDMLYQTHLGYLQDAYNYAYNNWSQSRFQYYENVEKSSTSKVRPPNEDLFDYKLHRPFCTKRKLLEQDNNTVSEDNLNNKDLNGWGDDTTKKKLTRKLKYDKVSEKMNMFGWGDEGLSQKKAYVNFLSNINSNSREPLAKTTEYKTI